MTETTTAVVRPRAIAIGLLGTVLVCVWTPYNNYKIVATLIGGTQFPTIAIAALVLLAVGNGLLRRRSARAAFTGAELATIWSLLLVSSGIASSGMMRTFIPNIPAPRYFANSINDWENRVWADQPSWLKMADSDAAVAFYAGYPRGDEHVPWSAWAVPLLGWGAHGVFFLIATFCVARVLRRQWIEYERFSFPLVALPMLLTNEPESGNRLPPLLRNRLFWFGAILCGSLHGLNGFHRLYPSLPEITTQWNLMDVLTAPPWNQIGPFAIFVYPLVIGLGYLLPGEVGLSLWLFHLLFKAQCLVAGINNWDQPAAIGFFSQRQFHSLQAFGGALALTIWCGYTARAHLKQVLVSRENRSLRVWFCVGFGGMFGWLLLAGVPPFLAAFSLLLCLLAMVTVGWATCQAGVLFMAMPFTALDILAPTVGTSPFSSAALYTLYRAEYSFVYNTREMLLPGLLNAFKLGESVGVANRSQTKILAVAVLLAVVFGAWACIRLPYVSGGANNLTERWTYETGPQIPLKVLGAAAALPYRASWSNFLHVGGGFSLVGGLLLARLRFGAGLHPIGFIAASVHGVHTTWFSILLGWAAKTLVARFGGMALYRAALPFFLGLIVGDALSAAFWIAIGYATGIGYNNLPS